MKQGPPRGEGKHRGGFHVTYTAFGTLEGIVVKISSVVTITAMAARSSPGTGVYRRRFRGVA